ncbi:MAG: hypothetical protein LBE33_04860 [Zoogloeaceae bacterium]|jgi:hypothetical protein|nr:hypothetical protein [Zoogloeaceae bacterium]
MSQSDLTITWFLDNLRIHDENWNFDGVQETYRRLCSLDNYYYANFLIWLAEASFLEEIHALLEDKGTDFFLTLLSDPKYSEKQIRAVRAIINWYSKIFLPIMKGGTAPHADPYEQTILALYRDRDFVEMKKYVRASFVPIFRRWKCRQMTGVFALFALAQYGDFDLEMRKLSNRVFPTPLRSKRLAKLLVDGLDSDQFFGCSPVNMQHIIQLLTKIARSQETHYQTRLLDLVYRKLGQAVEYKTPLRQIPLKDAYVVETQNAPIVSIGRPSSTKKPRIAVCLTGQTRGTSACLESLRNNVIAPLQADVFLSTWDKAPEWPGVFKSSQLICRTFGSELESLFPIPELDNAAAFQAAFPHLFATFSEGIVKDLNVDFYENHFPLAAYKIENESDFLRSIPFDIKKLEYQGTHNQAKMFYKNYSVMQLLLEHEKQHGIKYDYIIRMRPDLRYPIPAHSDSFEIIKEGVVYLSYLRAGFGPADNIWVARRDTMLKMCSIWQSMLDAQSIFVFKDQECVSHYLTAIWIGKQGLTSRDRSMVRHGGYFSFKDMGMKFSGMHEALEKDLNTTAIKWQPMRQKMIDFINVIQ